VYVGNLLGAVSALDAGITTLRDESNIQNSPQHSDAAIQGLRDAGTRAVFDHGWPATEGAAWLRDSKRPHADDIRRIRREVLGDDSALVTMGVMLRGPELTTPEVTTADIRLMRELGLRGCVHAGCGPASRNLGVRQLHTLKLMGPDLCYVHCCHCSDEELRFIGDSGGSVSVAPVTDANMPGLGWPATGRALKAGLTTSLSIDVEASAAGDMFSAMRAAFTAQQLSTMRPPLDGDAPGIPVDARALLRMATLDGARACGLDARTGSLTPGKAADLIAVRADDLNLAPATDAATALVAGAHAGNVDAVMVAGRFVKRGGRLLHVDVARVLAAAAQSRDRLLAPA
jgi:5-methylthioadenosine/S-adenosylhomocysteine deaminase